MPSTFKRERVHRFLASLLLLLLLWVGVMLFVDSCRPVARLQRPPTLKDRVLRQEQYDEQAVHCAIENKQRAVYRVTHHLIFLEYVSGRVERQQVSDTAFVGYLSIDVGCPEALE